MFKKNTVADWMENEGIGYNEAAAKYEVGQNLTYAEAKDIIRMIAQAMGFREEHPGQHNNWRRGCDSYRKVIFKYALLIEAKKSARATGIICCGLLWMKKTRSLATNSLMITSLTNSP